MDIDTEYTHIETGAEIDRGTYIDRERYIDRGTDTDSDMAVLVIGQFMYIVIGVYFGYNSRIT